MLLFGGDLSRRDAIIDLSGGYAQQAGGFSNRDALTVSLVRAGNSMLVTDPSDTGISEVFPSGVVRPSWFRQSAIS